MDWISQVEEQYSCNAKVVSSLVLYFPSGSLRFDHIWYSATKVLLNILSCFYKISEKHDYMLYAHTSSRYFTISTLSFRAALWSGISLISSVALILAPWSTNSFTMSRLFFTAATWRGLSPKIVNWKKEKKIRYLIESYWVVICFLILI